MKRLFRCDMILILGRKDTALQSMPFANDHLFLSTPNPIAAAARTKSWITTITVNRKIRREIVNLKKQNSVVTLICASWNIRSIQFWKATCTQITMPSTQLAALLYSILTHPPKMFVDHTWKHIHPISMKTKACSATEGLLQ